MRTSKLIGIEVYNENGDDIGKLEDILVKDFDIGAAGGPLRRRGRR